MIGAEVTSRRELDETLDLDVPTRSCTRFTNRRKGILNGTMTCLSSASGRCPLIRRAWPVVVEVGLYASMW